MKSRKPVDWAEKKTKQKVIVDQRQFLWHEDTLEKLAAWMGLRQGMNTLDVGCGLGYLGQTFWNHFGKNGSYTGLDISLPLLRQALMESPEWARGGAARFVRGSAANLPFPDNVFDWTACQTLLMHSAEPDRFLSEMVRVTRPGGVVMCNEPNNISAIRGDTVNSWSEKTIDQELLRFRVMHHWAQGRKKLGFGDYAIGNRVPEMMREQGLHHIDIRCNDMVSLLLPPYDTPSSRSRLEQIGKAIEEQEKRGNRGFRMDREFRAFYFAGGGTEYTWRKFLAMIRETSARDFSEKKRQFEEGTLHICPGTCSFFCITGRKP